MLPARLLGLRSVWRSAVISRTPPSTSYSMQVHHRRLGLRLNSSTASSAKFEGDLANSSTASNTPDASNEVKFDPSEPRLAIAFTCTADGCNHRSAHTFTKRSYERGIVLIQCPSCKNRHLIADNLGWFKDDTEEGRLKNIEDILRARGEQVQRGKLDENGVLEFA